MLVYGGWTGLVLTKPYIFREWDKFHLLTEIRKSKQLEYQKNKKTRIYRWATFTSKAMLVYVNKV